MSLEVHHIIINTSHTEQTSNTANTANTTNTNQISLAVKEHNKERDNDK